MYVSEQTGRSGVHLGAHREGPRGLRSGWGPRGELGEQTCRAAEVPLGPEVDESRGPAGMGWGRGIGRAGLREPAVGWAGGGDEGWGRGWGGQSRVHCFKQVNPRTCSAPLRFGGLHDGGHAALLGSWLTALPCVPLPAQLQVPKQAGSILTWAADQPSSKQEGLGGHCGHHAECAVRQLATPSCCLSC